MSQADDFFKQAISLIPEVPAYVEIEHKKVHTEAMVLAFVQVILISKHANVCDYLSNSALSPPFSLSQNFCSSLVIMPGHPEHGPFYLIRGLLNVLAKFEWQDNSGL